MIYVFYLVSKSQTKSITLKSDIEILERSFNEFDSWICSLCGCYRMMPSGHRLDFSPLVVSSNMNVVGEGCLRREAIKCRSWWFGSEHNWSLFLTLLQIIVWVFSSETVMTSYMIDNRDSPHDYVGEGLQVSRGKNWRYIFIHLTKWNRLSGKLHAEAPI